MLKVEEFLEEWNNSSGRVLVHTSGSTGEPKAMYVEKRRMEASARMTCDFLGLHPGDTALLCLPLDFIAGKMMVVRSLVRGLRLVTVPPNGEPLSGVTDKVDFAAMVPLQVWNSLRVPEQRERLMNIGQLIVGGGAIDNQLAQELRDFPNAVWSTYGMTETLSHIAMRRLSGPEATPWYTPMEGVGVSLNDERCLVIDAPLVCDGRLVTNDVAELEPETQGHSLRRFRIIGRKDNVICSGGIKIQAEQVEQLLQPHLCEPYLLTKRSDPKFGEVAVLLTEGDAGEAQAVCERVLPKYFRPRACVHVGRIPMTATGKPARKEAEQLARQACRD